MSGIEVPADSDTDDYVECHNFHSNPTYESTSESKHKAEEIARSYEKEFDHFSQRETILKSNQLPENIPIHKLRLRMTESSETDYSEESGNCYVNPAYEPTLRTISKVEESVSSDYYEIDDLSHQETIPKRFQPPSNSLLNKLCVKVPAVTKTDESGNYNTNPEYENVRFSNQELRVRVSNVAETDESGNCNINPAYENVRFSDQEPRLRVSAVAETDGSGNYNSNPAYENVRFANQDLRVRTPGIAKMDAIKPVYENVSSADKELEHLSHLEMIRKRIQLPENEPCASMLLDHRKEDSSKRLNCHINLAYESTVNFSYKVGENARLDAHREMIRRSIQLPVRGPIRQPRAKMTVVTEKDDSSGSDNHHINLACESTLNIDRRASRNVETADQELDRLSYREIIRRSIQLPESNSQRRNKRCCTILDSDHKEERLLVAYVLLVGLSMMTFGSITLTIIIRTIPLKFFPNCWMLTIALASLCCLIGFYICWEGEICKSSRPRQEGLFIGMELTTFAEN